VTGDGKPDLRGERYDVAEVAAEGRRLFEQGRPSVEKNPMNRLGPTAQWLAYEKGKPTDEDPDRPEQADDGVADDAPDVRGGRVPPD
jgi:hypothetical protein